MKKKPKIFKDREKIIFQYPKEPGSVQRVDTYLTTRAGVSWPSPTAPGYYCILGLSDEPTLTEKNPLVLLAEGEHKLMEKFFERMAVTANRLFCNRIFANLEHNKGFEDSLFKFVRQRKLERIRPWDSSEFEDFDHGVSLIRQYKRDSALIVSEKSILLTQIQSMTPDDLSGDFEERFYAVAALCRVLGSFEAYPWRKSPAIAVGFGNFDDRGGGGSGWNGSYQEMTP